MPMRKLILLLLSGVLSTACVDKDYDLGNIDTDNIAIGDRGVAVPHPAGQGARLEGRDQKQRRRHRKDLPRSRHLVSHPAARRQIRRPRQIAERAGVCKHAAPNAARGDADQRRQTRIGRRFGLGQIRRGFSAASQPDGARRANLQDGIQNRLPQRRIAARTARGRSQRIGPHLPDRARSE